MVALDDLPVPTLKSQVDTGREIIVPWMHKPISLGTGFSSKLITSSNPWITTKSPFDTKKLQEQPLSYDGRVEGSAKYRDNESTSHSTGTEHTSGSLGATVGCPFLSANVTGTYDKTVLETKDMHRVSQTCMVREGAIRFKQEPQLTREAKINLAQPGGPEAFSELYGDYYASCYVLGGDAGLYVSTSDDAVTTNTTEKVTVTVKVLFFSKSVSKTTSHKEFTETFEVTMSGYDTLSNSVVAFYPSQTPSEMVTVKQNQFEDIKAQSLMCLKQVERLQYRVREKLKDFHLINDRDELGWDHCLDICAAGLVVQLVLMPFSYLRDYKISVLSE